jgi:hypothetical protein
MTDKITCPKCGSEQPKLLDAGQETTECLKCGIVFAKFDPIRHDRILQSPSRKNIRESRDIYDTVDIWWYRTGKIFILALMGFFFFYMVVKRSSWCFLDYVNLPFHEFGHILFSPFGETLQFLGGTISQLMWPMILFVYFMKRSEPLASSFCLFWFGENFLNISKYIADARAMRLPLVGGGIHDWNFLFSKWDILRYDNTVANVIFVLGVLIMIGAIVWAFFAGKGKEKT